MLKTILVVLVFGVLWGAPAEASSGRSLRVLLWRSAQPVDIQFEGRPLRIRLEGRAWVSDGRRRAPTLRYEGGGRIGVRGRTYRGAVLVHRDGDALTVVNEVPLEDYVAGTVLAEVYGSWEESVLRAQAVATRTYAMYRAARATRRLYDVESTQLGQVYRGVAAESPRAWAAVEATAGQYLAWRDAPILAAFHSASGGRTASSAEVWGKALPYLVSLDVEGEEGSPDTYWRTYLSRREVQRVLALDGVHVGEVRDMHVVSHAPSGRVATIRVLGTRGEETLSPNRLRRVLGTRVVRSTLFRLRREGQGFWVIGSGRGHGVGMSQWGARALARRGLPYSEILARFYPGTRIRTLREPSTATPQVSSGPAARQEGGTR